MEDEATHKAAHALTLALGMNSADWCDSELAANLALVARSRIDLAKSLLAEDCACCDKGDSFNLLIDAMSLCVASSIAAQGNRVELVPQESHTKAARAQARILGRASLLSAPEVPEIDFRMELIGEFGAMLDQTLERLCETAPGAEHAHAESIGVSRISREFETQQEPAR